MQGGSSGGGSNSGGRNPTRKMLDSDVEVDNRFQTSRWICCESVRNFQLSVCIRSLGHVMLLLRPFSSKCVMSSCLMTVCLNTAPFSPRHTVTHTYMYTHTHASTLTHTYTRAHACAGQALALTFTWSRLETAGCLSEVQGHRLTWWQQIHRSALETPPLCTWSMACWGSQT